MFKKPITVNYPDQKFPMFPKWRGKQVLMRDEDGLEKCVACGLCAVACPADAIYLEAAENDGSVMAGPRYAKVYQIHKTRCIFCGYCEEACPVSAIFMGKDYELAVYSKNDFIWDKDDLLVPAPAQAPVAGRPACRRASATRAAELVKPFLEALDERVLICDGAMGTMLYAKGVFLNRCFDELNLTQPDLVADVHQAYVRAGADIIETNTFGANRVKLAPFGLADAARTRSTCRARGIARQAARDQAYVAGAIGPLGVRVEPWGKTGLDEAEAIFREQAAGARRRRRRPVHARDVPRLERARRRRARRPRRRATLPIVAQLTTGDDGHTLDGTPPEQFTPRARIARRRRDRRELQRRPGGDARHARAHGRVAPRRALSAQPNAGKPRDVEGRNIYLSSPEYMASYARRFIAAGVKLVGGCCGTTPEHVTHIARRARAAPARRRPRRRDARATVCRRGAAAPIVRSRCRGRDKSRLANALARGQFVIAVDLAPPRGYACTTIVEQARELQISGVDACSSPIARAAAPA